MLRLTTTRRGGARVREPRDHRAAGGARRGRRRRRACRSGRTVTNPVNGEQIPMCVADYVLMEYGTGAIMAVPAHDERDFDFAQAFGLPIAGDRAADRACGRGLPLQRRRADGQLGPLRRPGQPRGVHARSSTGSRREGRGQPAINYRLRDWLLSRQRYWGCPIPIVHCDACGLVPVPDDQLPVVLPDVQDYAPKGKSPLAAAEDWVNVPCPKCGGPGAARDRHDGHLRRLLLVLPALLRRPQRPGAVGPRGSSTAGCRSTSTSAASSTRSCT